MNTVSAISNRPRVICLFGPTAVGKTEALERLCSFPIEIVNADSMQVYKYMDVGTAKPGKELLRSVPHHLISIVEPDYQYSVGDFVRRCDVIIPKI